MALVIDHVSKRFGGFLAIDDVSFTVQEGRMFGFLGTNGAGKTTAMRMVLDILRPDSGTITWNGMSNRQIARQEFGYLPEERGLYPKMTVQEQLLFLAQLYGAEKRAAQAALDEWLARLDIEENRHKTIEQLSKGNQQKIQFLAAVLHDPEILILDEPFSGLDPVNIAQMEAAFNEMKARGKTIIFSTHQLSQAQRLCEDVAIIHRGRLLVAGDVEAVRESIDVKILRVGVAGDERLEWLDPYPEVEIRQQLRDHIEMQIPDEAVAQRILRDVLARGETVELFEVTVPSLNDVFLTRVRQSGATAEDIARIEASRSEHGEAVA
ncbi:MAG TPA: ATP-binding cassette domain-containing protein [Thermomicrobiales bacterium]|nr:ATP-binding cassette domain-containing protein [Thermomicrobiales bacterium]